MNIMNILRIILSYIITILVFIALDMAWLGLVAKNLYRKYLGSLLSEKVNWIAAIAFYLIFIAGIFIFVIYPSVEKQSITRAMILGAVFGFITYATYDLTNYATLKDFPLTIVFIDLVWGAVITSLVSLVGFYIVKLAGSI
ncbi:MAG: DUF2177 family protein [Bacteroidales bacterium]|jgi:uncharacterized membrane protein